MIKRLVRSCSPARSRARADGVKQLTYFRRCWPENRVLPTLGPLRRRAASRHHVGESSDRCPSHPWFNVRFVGIGDEVSAPKEGQCGCDAGRVSPCAIRCRAPGSIGSQRPGVMLRHPGSGCAMRLREQRPTHLVELDNYARHDSSPVHRVKEVSAADHIGHVVQAVVPFV